MAAICEDPNGRKRIQFVGPDGKRRAIRLGKLTLRQAEKYKAKVEVLVGALISGDSLDTETMDWVKSKGDKFHAKLAGVGLVKPRLQATQTSLIKFFDAYIDRLKAENATPIVDGKSQPRTGAKPAKAAKPNTLKNWAQVRQWLVKFFGENKDIRTVTVADAEDFRHFMLTNGLGENSARRHLGRSRQIFRAAIRREVYAGVNPFEEMETKVQSDKGREFFVTREMADKVIAACPNAQWRLLVALARYGGIRMPSEALPLRWGDIHWDKNRIHITSPKTEHHEGKDSRMIPLFPELVKPLQDAFAEAEEGSQFVISQYRDHTANLRTHFNRIVRKAGLKPWAKPFHNMRSTRQTELSEQYPEHVVCAWIGNIEKIARDHYLQLRDDHFEKAALICAQQPSEVVPNSEKSSQSPVKETAAFPVSADKCLSLQHLEYPQGESNPCSPAENRLS